MAQDSLIGPKRTILYYPTCSIPDSKWLRQALLYFDEVASIVPSNVNGWTEEVGEALVPLTPDIELLQGEGEFRRVPPELLFLRQHGVQRSDELLHEFKQAINSEPFRQLLPALEDRRYTELHRDKLSEQCVGYLENQNLIKFDEQLPGYREWLLVEEHTALLYMSLLAQALADVDHELTVTGTDLPVYDRLVFYETSPDNGFACLATRFFDVLPVPRDDVPFSRILRFKRKKKGELRHFREKIDELQKRLATAREQRELTEILAQSSNSLQVELDDLTQQLHDERIPIILGSIKSLMSVQSPTTWISALALAGPLVGVHVATASLALPVLAVAGTVEVSYHFITKRKEQRATLRASPFAYLYHAREGGIF
jgi:hypothetical protein